MGDTANNDNNEEEEWWVYEGQECVPPGVTRVRIGPGVERIQEQAFEYHKLERLDFSGATALRVIEEQAFARCESLKGILRISPPQLREIQKEAFFGCSKLETIDCTDATKALTTIGRGAFSYCHSLTTAILPAGSSITEFGIDVFEECPNLELVRIPDHNNFFVALRIAADSCYDGPWPEEDCRSTNNLLALFHLQPMQPEDLAKRHEAEWKTIQEYTFQQEYCRGIHTKEVEKLQEIQAKHDQLSPGEVDELVTSYAMNKMSLCADQGTR